MCNFKHFATVKFPFDKFVQSQTLSSCFDKNINFGEHPIDRCQNMQRNQFFRHGPGFGEEGPPINCSTFERFDNYRFYPTPIFKLFGQEISEFIGVGQVAPTLDDPLLLNYIFGSGWPTISGNFASLRLLTPLPLSLQKIMPKVHCPTFRTNNTPMDASTQDKWRDKKTTITETNNVHNVSQYGD